MKEPTIASQRIRWGRPKEQCDFMVSKAYARKLVSTIIVN